MRLHHLSVTAFGPFAGTEAVDFDALGDAGLFLLSGPTGAGKSSVLDAVTFALYGDVPGDRSTAKRLRSDHAAEAAAPRVVLECTLSGRRWRIDRSPAWQRPKKRGPGTTTEQARVVLSERVDGTWLPRATRIDDAGHLLSEQLGMTLGQFTQVAMLPQGAFQTFLRARADERKKVLEQLFRTHRFSDVEAWLVQRRRDLHRTSEQHQQRLQALLHRVGEVTDTEPPEFADTHDSDPGGASGARDEVESWLARRCLDLDTRLDDLRTRIGPAEDAVRAAEAHRRGVEELLVRQQRGQSATQGLAELDARADEQRVRRARLAAAARAERVVPLAELADEAARTLDEAVSSTAEAETAVLDLLGGEESDAPVRESWRECMTRSTDLAARARALAPRERRATELQRVLREQTLRREALADECAHLEDDLRSLPAAIDRAREEAQASRDARAALPATHRTVTELEQRLEAVHALARLEETLGAASAAVREARDSVMRHKEIWLDLREQRLAGMAAEIAADLAVGADCPVCGSVEHPHPAEAAPDAPDRAAERRARARLDDAEVALVAAEEHQRGLVTRRELHRHRIGDSDPDRLPVDLARAREERDQAQVLADHWDAATEHLCQREQQLVDVQQRRLQLATDLEGLDQRIAASREETGALAADLAALAREADLPEESGAARVEAHHAGLADACERLGEQLSRLAEAEAAQRRAQHRARAVAGDAGFGSVREAREAALDPAAETELVEQARDHEARRIALASELDDPEVAAALGLPSADVTSARAAEEEAVQVRTRLHTDEQRLTRVRSRVAELGSDVTALFERWSPVLTDLDLTRRVAALAEGRSADNQWQMRLSAYVLNYRLGQVVDAANERLVRMSGERYLLEHTGDRGAGDRRGGLGLRVRDAWSGLSRDPATLSGGETFVVSLALALGLSDVITHEAAGARLDTLIVDEGFGSLDPDTLDDVMDTLDSLREGGRVVGVVSHVAEMADRIPAQVRVSKGRSGSTVAVVGV